MHAKILLIFALLSVFSFGTSVFAQETLEEPTNEDAVQYEVSEEETTSEETSEEDTTSEEAPEEKTLEDHCEKTMGNDLDALLCRAVLDLQIRVSDLEAGITGMQVDSSEEGLDEEIDGEVTEEASPELVGSPLMQMMSGVDPDQVQCKSGQALIFKASNSHPTCVSELSFNALISRGWIASYDPSLDVIMEEEATPDGATETMASEAQGQNYTADLSEDIEMGAN